MGQKSNVLTLKKNKNLSNFSSENSQTFIKSFVFLRNLNRLFENKGVLVAKKEFQSESNNTFLNLNLFFRSKKLIQFRRRGFSSIWLQSQKKSSSFPLLFSESFDSLKNLSISIKNLNNYLDRSDLVFFYNSFKRFERNLFSRRFSLFIDFLKMTALFSGSKISSDTYLYLLGQIFKILPKSRHSTFLVFLKTVFQTLINSDKNLKNSSIIGLKIIISGKLKGKPRSSSAYVQVGPVPVQSVSKNVDFAKLNVYTLSGSFGLKFWVNKI
jgi:hypothetical protein